MAGVKGRSGRKPGLDDKTIQQVCRMSVANVIRAFRSKTVSMEFKAELGKHFILRSMPQRVEGGEGHFQIVQVYIPSERPEIRDNKVDSVERSTDLIPFEPSV